VRPTFTGDVPGYLRAVAETYADDAVMFRSEGESNGAVIYSTIASELRQVADKIDKTDVLW
jgi:hypothetical protein